MSEEASGDRRRDFRLVLTSPMHGRVGSTPVLVYDMSVRGLRIVHTAHVPRVGQTLLLVIDHETQRIEPHCEVRRTQVRTFAASRKLFESGLRIAQAEQPSLKSFGELFQTEGRKACTIPRGASD